MKFILPENWIIPNEDGTIPEVLVGIDATTTWLDVVDFWTSLGYFLTKASGSYVQMEFLDHPNLSEKNDNMQLAWWLWLCDFEQPQSGEVYDWQAVVQLHPDVYSLGEVPVGIPNRTYFDNEDPPNELVRKWNQWGSPNHIHYYVENYQDDIVDRYMVPTWSWGFDLLGTEMMSAQKTSGTNIIARSTLTKMAQAEALTNVPITPAP